MNTAVQAMAAASGEPGIRLWQRGVSDGHLSVLVAQAASPLWDAPKWHLSISHRTNDHPAKPGRYPDWDEIAEARYRFVPDDVTMALLLPPQREYVNIMRTCFHLWQVESGTAGMPVPA